MYNIIDWIKISWVGRQYASWFERECLHDDGYALWNKLVLGLLITVEPQGCLFYGFCHLCRLFTTFQGNLVRVTNLLCGFIPRLFLLIYSLIIISISMKIICIFLSLKLSVTFLNIVCSILHIVELFFLILRHVYYLLFYIFDSIIALKITSFFLFVLFFYFLNYNSFMYKIRFLFSYI